MFSVFIGSANYRFVFAINEYQEQWGLFPTLYVSTTVGISIPSSS